MTKKNNFVTAFVWTCNILDTENLSIAEQAVLLNLLKLINRNFWKPIKISAYKLSRTMCCDTRTIQKALRNLKDKNVIHMKGDLIYLGNISENQFQSLISESSDEQISKPIQHTTRTDNNSDTNTTNATQKTLADF